MKKSYEKPDMCVVRFQHLSDTIQTSVTGKFSDDAPKGGWDQGGANAKSRQIWDDEND